MRRLLDVLAFIAWLVLVGRALLVVMGVIR